ncbi:MAG: nitrilase [Peptococcaceae bacterium]|nr:nitrilase [Peptococcaceae bacterium]
MQDTRIALVQMRALTGRIEANLAGMEQFTAHAARSGADIICFPELSATGYARRPASLLAEEVPGKTAAALARMARTHGITVLAGLVEAGGYPPQAGQRPFITHLVCCPDGIVSGYRKTHLGRSERPFFSAGDDLPVFSLPKARIAIAICWDMHFPEVAACLALKGAEIIFTPHASPEVSGDRRELWLKYLPARAYDNAAFVAACNLVGQVEGGRRFSGGLMVFDPRGRLLAEAGGPAEEMLVVDLPAQTLNEIRHGEARSMRQNFFLSFRRPELYRKLLD